MSKQNWTSNRVFAAITGSLSSLKAHLKPFSGERGRSAHDGEAILSVSHEKKNGCGSQEALHFWLGDS